MTVTQTSRVSQDRTQSKSDSDGDLLQLDTPVVSLHVHRPHMPRMPRLPGMSRMQDMTGNRGQEMDRAMETARTFLPPPERIAYYGGLGLLAALGLMEWPVAAAIGAGTMLAARACASARESGEQPESRPAERTSRARTSTPRASRTASTRASSTRAPRSSAGTSSATSGRSASRRAGSTPVRTGSAQKSASAT